MEKHIEIQADAETAMGSRLDVFLSEQLEGFTRSRLQKLIDQGLVKVSGEIAKAGMKLKGGEVISLVVPPDVPATAAAQEIPLDIVFEDKYLAVINKPVGMVTHPGAGVSDGTLVNALLHHCEGELSGISGVLRPGIVHRLDKDTSGLLVVAKEDKTHQGLSEQIRDKTARRVYLAVLEGVMKSDGGTIDKPIGRHPVRRKEMAVVSTGRKAVSHFEVLRRSHKYTLVKVSLETGRTHQIRVHMASLGFPVVGDIVYNRKQTGNEAARAKLGLKGHALHAVELSFTHPVTGRLLQFEAPLPPEFQRLIDTI
jgi:23S rRNA pseudouridine1911/1915/1917 synthase